jgi:hypothetical protein
VGKKLRAATGVSARDVCVAIELSAVGAGLPTPGRSGQSRFRKPKQIPCFCRSRREPIIFGTQPGYLELQCLNPGTQSGDLVEQTPIGRPTNVAVEGLRHIVSL